MTISSDSELEKDEDHQEEIIEIEGSSLETISEEKSLVISEDIFPDSLLVVPLYDRPLFPKMLLPVIISDKKLEKVLEDELKGPLKYVGLVYSNETDENSDETKENINDRLANIGADLTLFRSADRSSWRLPQPAVGNIEDMYSSGEGP